MTRRRIEYWVIPPETDAEFVAHMEQVLDLYQQPYDPDCPVVCMDDGVDASSAASECAKVELL